MAAWRIPEGLTVRVTTNKREKTTRILAYRKGRFKYAYKAVLPMCEELGHHHSKPHSTITSHYARTAGSSYTTYHQSDVDKLVKELIKTYR